MHQNNEDKILRSLATRDWRRILRRGQQEERDLLRANVELEKKVEELDHSLSLMRAALEAARDGILVTDVEGRVSGYNENLLRMWKLGRTDLAATDHRNLVTASGIFSESAKHVELLNEICASSPPETFDVLELADGRVLEQCSRLQCVDEGAVVRVWSFRDITERHHTEDELRNDRYVLESLNRAGNAMASTLDLQILVQVVTDAATDLSGAALGAFFFNPAFGSETCWSRESSSSSRSVIEKFGRSLISPLFDSMPQARRAIRWDDLLKESSDVQTVLVADMHGTYGVRSCLAVPVASRSGEMFGGLFLTHPNKAAFDGRTERIIAAVAAQAAIAIDNARLYEVARRSVEERERLLERERMACAAAERVLANLSHELRTPLNVISGWAKVLRSGVKDEADLRNGLDSIERNARVQTRLIGDLQDMHGVASGTLHLNMQPIAPLPFIEEAIETVRPAAEAREILIQKQLDPEVPINGDPNRLQQVVRNLLSNAIKFTGKGGRVQVSLMRLDSQAEIAVADNGIGIRPECLEHIFEPFRQEEASTSRQSGGLGVGLSIVKHLVELHGGTVSVESPGEGCGATFRVQLPLGTSHCAAYDDQRAQPAGSEPRAFHFLDVNLSGVRVLVVDDEMDARNLIQRVLSDCHAEVFTAGSAGDALRMVEGFRPHVLLSDIGMPDGDGYELMKQVRALEHTKGGKIPAIALTAFARPEDRTRALRAGFLEHVTKPVEPSELVATVASVAGRNGVLLE